MQPSTQKWMLLGLLAVSVAAVARIGFAAFAYRQSQSATRAAEDRFQPSEAVRRLLDRTDAPAPRLDGQFPCVLAPIENSDPHPQLGKCSLPTEHSGRVDRLEADLRYGNFVVRQSDLYLKDVFDVPLTRSYNSNDYLNTNPVHAFGRHANHPFDIAPVGSRYPYTYILSLLEDGDFLYFPRVSPGTSYSDAIFQHTETSTGYYKAVIAWNGDGWTLFREDGLGILFPEAYASTNAAQGAPYAMRDSEGNVLRLLRDDQRNLQEIQTPHKHSLRFKYDDHSRITRADDDQGHWAEYHYDGNSMLTDAIFFSGRARHYSYEGDLMTVIADENQKVLVRNSYINRWLVRQDFGNGEVYSYRYTGSGTSYADAAIITLPNGTTMTIDVAGSVPEARKHPPN